VRPRLSVRGQVGSVIRNPEVQALVPVLLTAISEPSKATRSTLDVLLDTVGGLSVRTTCRLPVLRVGASPCHHDATDRLRGKRAARP
jgi:hypothetical protein